MLVNSEHCTIKNDYSILVKAACYQDSKHMMYLVIPHSSGTYHLTLTKKYIYRNDDDFHSTVANVYISMLIVSVLCNGFNFVAAQQQTSCHKLLRLGRTIDGVF